MLDLPGIQSLLEPIPVITIHADLREGKRGRRIRQMVGPDLDWILGGLGVFSPDFNTKVQGKPRLRSSFTWTLVQFC